MQARLSSREDVEKLLNTEEGCRLEGYITVNKIAGNIHLAPGISFEQNHQVNQISFYFSKKIV